MKDQRKLAAIMFTDISGYSALMSEDEKQAMAILRRNRNIHKSAVARFNGEYIKEIGDGTLAIFQSSLDAVNCAFRILKSCGKESNLAVRIGIHIGDIVFKDGDVFGDGVNVASRIEAVGQAGGIYVSERVYEDIKNKAGIKAEFYGRKLLKNIPDPVNIYEIGCADDKTAGKEIGRTGISPGKSKKGIGKQGIIRKYAISFMVMIAIAVYIFYPNVFKEDKLEILRREGRISLAVMPFQNLTNDTLWNIWQDGIQNELINILSNTEELRVRQTETIHYLINNPGITNYASITPAFARNVSRKLKTNFFIYGSIKQAGSIIRINAQLINSETEEIFKTFQIEDKAEEDNIFKIIDLLSLEIKNYLLITLLEKELTQEYRAHITTKSPEAYRYYIKGMNAFHKNDFGTARKLLLQAAAVDSNFYAAIMNAAYSYGNQGNYPEAKKMAVEIYRNRDQIPLSIRGWADLLYALYFETPYEEIKYAKQMLEYDDKSPTLYYTLGIAYHRINQYDKAIPELEKVLALFNEWGVKPYMAADYAALGRTYHKLGMHRKGRKLYKKAEKDFPGDMYLLPWQAILELSAGKKEKASEYIEKFVSFLKELSVPEAIIAQNLAMIYSQAGIVDLAENYFREALKMESENSVRLNNLAHFLIDSESDVNEGMELIEKALGQRPDHFSYLHTKGLGLYKQGKYNEALEILQRSWDLRREFSVYDHEAFMHLEEARKAASGMS